MRNIWYFLSKANNYNSEQKYYCQRPWVQQSSEKYQESLRNCFCIAAAIDPVRWEKSRQRAENILNSICPYCINKIYNKTDKEKKRCSWNEIGSSNIRYFVEVNEHEFCWKIFQAKPDEDDRNHNGWSTRKQHSHQD